MDDAPLDLPARPEPPARAPLPVAQLIAPLVLAAVVFAVTASPLSLLFALLSPVLALASLVDGRVSSRRRRRRARVARATALDALDRAVQARLAARRLTLEREHPSPAVLADDPARWRARPPHGLLVLGSADRPVAPGVRGEPLDERERAIVARSSVLEDAPFVLPADASIAVHGPAPLAQALARAVGVARARAQGAAIPADVVADENATAHDLVVRIHSASRAVVVHAGPATGAVEGRSLRPALVTAASFARVAPAEGRARPELSALAAAAPPGPLTAVFAVGDGGDAIAVDLAEGPHAVVAGTTGSGKSALLTAWLLALATAHPPRELGLLLVDCKGGAAFDPLVALPHVAGVVTDLDPAGIHRAVSGLAAELRRRERVLREEGVADAARTGLARLVVVVDEYRALVDRAPELAAVFTDVAARGRSLGVHLVLCTQRATGTFRDELLANCGLRIGLRMRDPSDSVALLGRSDAAHLPQQPGVAVLAADGAVHRLRIADVSEPGALAAAVAARWDAAGAGRGAVPWFPPLPARLPVASLPAAPPGAVVLGLLDLPDEQRQPPLVWRPDRSPSLAVVGLSGSGRSNVLDLAAAALGTTVLPDDAPALWDALSDARSPLVVDDVEALLDRLGAAHAAQAVERLAARVRSRGAPTIMAFREPAAWTAHGLRGAVQLFDARLLLRLAQDDRIALGAGRAPRDPLPGRGEWDGVPAQVALAAGPAARGDRPRSRPLSGAGPWLLLTGDATGRTLRLRSAGLPIADAPGEPGVWVGPPAAWQAAWSALARLQQSLPVLVDLVSPADVRTLTGIAPLLPPVGSPDDVVLIEPGAAPVRARLPRGPIAAVRAGR